MPKFTVAVQYRSVRTVVVTAASASDAVEKASRRIERSGDEVIACRVEPAPDA